jgi:hypothetical protein
VVGYSYGNPKRRDNLIGYSYGNPKIPSSFLKRWFSSISHSDNNYVTHG